MEKKANSWRKLSITAGREHLSFQSQNRAEYKMAVRVVIQKIVARKAPYKTKLTEVKFTKPKSNLPLEGGEALDT